MMHMNSNLLVIIDSSGSMNEWGKLELVSNLIVTIVQNYTARFITWNESVTDLDVSDLTNLNLEFSGESKLEVLQNYLKEQQFDKIILLSDGSLNFEKGVNLKKFTITPVAIGIDAVTSNLEKIFGVEVEPAFNILKTLK